LDWVWVPVDKCEKPEEKVEYKSDGKEAQSSDSSLSLYLGDFLPPPPALVREDTTMDEF
jgi:hypothetical protein